MVATHDLNDTTRSRTMHYDGLDRLVEAQSAIFGCSGVHRFEYDAVDNLMHWTLGGVKDYARYVYGADNRLAWIEGTGGGTLHTFSHDVQGNVTDKDSTDYHFDLGNRLRAVVAPTITETYRYDGHGRRVLAWTSAGSKLSMYSATGQILYQQLFPAAQNKAIDYIYLSGSLVANREVPLGGGTAVVKYQHTDALGSPVAVTDGTGAVIERTNYDPYGGVIGGPKDGVGYTGHVMDAGTGLHYMQQRYYDPAMGRLLSIDPVGAAPINGGNFNRYWYGNNGPSQFTDPDGRMAVRSHKGFCEMVKACIVDKEEEREGDENSQQGGIYATDAQRKALKRLSYSSVRRGEGSIENKFYMDDEGQILGTSQKGCYGDDRCRVSISELPKGTTLVGHLHVKHGRSRISELAALTREFPGPGDASPLNLGLTSAVFMPSGARYLIEGSPNAVSISYLGGGDGAFGAFVERNWRPGMTDQEITDAVGRFMSEQ